MKQIIQVCEVISPNHVSRSHPEGPHRFNSIRAQLSEYLADEIAWLEPKVLSDEALTTVHPETYIRFIQDHAAHGPGIVDYGDTYVTKSSFEDGLNAVGGTLAVLDSILSGEVQKGFAIIRPPGHHASVQKAMGFCLFNNVALAAEHARSAGLARVAIVDFDVHHGNGTQDIFYEHPDVLYISTHQEGIFPGTGALTEIGAGSGRGTTINIPLPGGVGDLGLLKTFDTIITPALHQFKPELLLVSAGYDAHYADPLAGLQMSSKGYYQITSKLVEAADNLCQGRMMMVLEGGYNPKALSESIRNSCFALSNVDFPNDLHEELKLPEPGVEDLLEKIRSTHSI